MECSAAGDGSGNRSAIVTPLAQWVWSLLAVVVVIVSMAWFMDHLLLHAWR